MTKLLTRLKTDTWRWTLGYYFLFICLGLGSGVLGPTLPSLAGQTQTRLGEMGALFVAGSIGVVLGTAAGGRVFDRVKGNRALGLAQLMSAALIVCVPLIPWFWLLLAVLVCKGLADGLVNVGANTLLVWTHREKSGPFMNALHFFFGLGAFLSPFLVAQVVSVEGGYRWVFETLGILGALAGLNMLTLKSSPQPRHAAVSTTKTDTRIYYPLVIAAMLFLFFYVGAEISFGGWVYTYALTLNLADATTAAYLTSAFWLTFTIGRLISIPLAMRFAPQRIVFVALVSCLSILGLAMIAPQSSWLAWIMALALGFCMAPIWPGGFTLAGRSLKLTARVSGIILLGDSFGGMVLPWLVGRVLDSIGPQAMVYVVFASMLGNTLAFAALLRLRRSAPAWSHAADSLTVSG